MQLQTMKERLQRGLGLVSVSLFSKRLAYFVTGSRCGSTAHSKEARRTAVSFIGGDGFGVFIVYWS
jgi:hypothetical protein